MLTVKRIANDSEIVLTVDMSKDCCHCVFVIADLYWDGGERLFLEAASRKAVMEKGENEGIRDIDLYYDPYRVMRPEAILDLIEKWKIKWIARGVAFGVRVNVTDVEKVEQWLRDGANYDLCIEREREQGKIYLTAQA